MKMAVRPHNKCYRTVEADRYGKLFIYPALPLHDSGREGIGVISVFSGLFSALKRISRKVGSQHKKSRC
jgi:hypothetical protein